MNAIVVEELRKSYDGTEAVKGVSFEVGEGSFTAFLGPNGAGKSTTISIICSLLQQDSGNVLVFGNSASSLESRRAIGVVFQDPLLDGMLTVRENLEVRGAMYGLSKEDLKDSVERVLDITDSMEFADQRYKTLSGGQRRRADIARALVHKPRLLILDEPTSGLDPRTRRTIWDTVSRLNRLHGLTVLLTTHYMEEAADADDVIIIAKGEIVARGTPSQLRDRYCTDSMTVVTRDVARVEGILRGMGANCHLDRDTVTVRLSRTADAVPMISALQGLVESLEVKTGTLDEAFLEITGEGSE